MPYSPLDVKTVIFSEHLSPKLSSHNPGYATLIASHMKVQKENQIIQDQNKPSEIERTERESEKIKRRALGEDRTQNFFNQGKNDNNQSKERNNQITHVVENGKGDKLDIIV